MPIDAVPDEPDRRPQGDALIKMKEQPLGSELVWSQPASLCCSHLSLAVVKAATGHKDRRALSDGGGCLSHRMGLALIGSMLFVQMYVHRISMGIAIVRMVNHTALSQYPYSDAAILHADSHNFTTGQLIDNTTMSVDPAHVGSNDSELTVSGSTSSVGLYPLDGTYGEVPCGIAVTKDTQRSEDGPFVWDKAAQGHLLGAFYYGFTVSQLPGALAVPRIGGTLLVTICIVLVAVGSCAVPLVAAWGYGYVIPLRVLLGIGEGALFPALVAVFGRWAPPHERTKLLGIVFAGGGLGLIVAHPIAGLLGHFSKDGWSLIFYALSLTTLLTGIPWLIFASDDPSRNRFTSAAEKQYIADCLHGQLALGKGSGLRTPWWSLATSLPVYAITVGMLTTDWGYTVYLSYIPTYLHEVLHMNLDKNALFSTLPFVGHTVVLVLCPMVIDTLISRQLIAVAAARKLAHSVGAVGAAVMLLGLSTVDCHNPSVAVVLLTMGVSLSGCVYSGFSVNVLDLSPVHGGTILALSSTISAVTGFLCPLGVTALTQGKAHEGWQHVFYLSAGIYLVGSVFYCVFGSSTLQPWGLDPELDGSCDTKRGGRERSGSEGRSTPQVTAVGDLENGDISGLSDLCCSTHKLPQDEYVHSDRNVPHRTNGDLNCQEVACTLQRLLDSSTDSQGCDSKNQRGEYI